MVKMRNSVSIEENYPELTVQIAMNLSQNEILLIYILSITDLLNLREQKELE